MTKARIPTEARLTEAVKQFWVVRNQQAHKQGNVQIASKDRGERGAVTGGKQMDGFVRLVFDLLVEAGLSGASIYCRARPDSPESSGKQVRRSGNLVLETRSKLPGWFRPEKDWDLLVVVDKCLIAAIELKSQVGPSFGNNFNNRTEEAVGTATDLRAAYREGAFKPSIKPWIGYLMLLEDAPGSTSQVRVSEPHFKVFEEFRDASYARRYDILLTKLVRESLYDAACLLTSTKSGGLRGEYREPNAELSFNNFAMSLLARAIAVAKVQGQAQQPRSSSRSRKSKN